jgi:type II secretory pathway pseudopilin PulG
MSEMLGTIFKYVFGILATGAVLLGVYSLNSNNKVTNAITETAMIAQNAQQIYAGQNNFTSLTNTVLITAGAVPSGNYTAPATITNPWAGAVTVAVGANANTFNITHAGVPNADCSKLVTSITSYSTVSINGNAQTPPVDAATLTNLCTTVAGNTIIFTYGGV